MLLKNTARNTLTAIALAGLFGITACGTGGNNSSEQSAPAGQESGTEQASPSQEATQGTDSSSKPAGWSDTLDVSGTVPAEWQGGSGWTTKIDEDSLMSIGDYIVYRDESGSKRTIVVVDGKGDKKETFAASESGFKEGDYSHMSAATAFKNGKKYLVVMENGEAEPDPTSVAAVEPKKAIVKVYDENLAKVWEKTIPDNVEVVKDAIVVVSSKDVKPAFDLATGAESTPKVPAEHKWAGRYDGVDIFTKEAEDFMGPGTATNGVWTVEYYEESGIDVFGSKMAMERPQNLGHQKGCDLIDPHTGKAFDITGPSGSCPQAKVTSPNGKFVYFTPEFSTSEGLPGIVSLATGKKFSISKEISFGPTAITDEGVVYGHSNHDVAVFDLNKDAAPKKLPDVEETPSYVASNGTAVFGVWSFITKK